MFKNIIVLLVFLISACSSDIIPAPNPTVEKKSKPGIFSKDSEKGISLTDLFSNQNNETTSINVNAYLWRASLDVLSIAPLISTDALGGTIITDWYSNKNINNQRLKITAFIKTSELRSDGISIKVYIQNFKNNTWSEMFTNKDLAKQIEDTILNKARDLRINSGN